MKRLTSKIASVLLALVVMLSMMPILGHQYDAYAAVPNATSTVNWKTSNFSITWQKATLSWDFNSTFAQKDSVAVIRYFTDGTQDTYVATLTSDNSYTSFTDDGKDSDLKPGQSYQYQLYRVDTNDYSNLSPVVTIPAKPADPAPTSDSSDSNGSSEESTNTSPGSTSSGSSSGSSTGVERPKLSEVQVSLSSSAAGSLDINYINHGEDVHSVYGIQVKYGNKKVLDADSANYSQIKTITVPYGKTVSLKYRVYRSKTVNSSEKDRVYSKSWKTLKKKCASLKKPVLSVTKISSNKAGLAWNKVPGASGYQIYCGKKLIKTIKKGSTTKYIYSKAGAGSKSYKVRAFIKNSKMKNTAYGSLSKQKKGKANEKKFSATTSVKSMPSFSAKLSISKIALNGGTYTVTAYALNNRIWDLQKYQKIDFTIYCDGKKVAHKVFRNMSCYVGAGNYKKISFKLKGKSGVDLRNSDGKTYSYKIEPYWKSIGTWVP